MSANTLTEAAPAPRAPQQNPGGEPRRVGGGFLDPKML